MNNVRIDSQAVLDSLYGKECDNIHATLNILRLAGTYPMLPSELTSVVKVMEETEGEIWDDSNSEGLINQDGEELRFRPVFFHRTAEKSDIYCVGYLFRLGTGATHFMPKLRMDEQVLALMVAAVEANYEEAANADDAG